MAVGRRTEDFLAGRDEVAAGLVLDQHGHAHVLTHLLRHQPRRDIGAAAGRQADDQADGLAGLKLLRRCRLGRQHGRECDHRRCQSWTPPKRIHIFLRGFRYLFFVHRPIHVMPGLVPGIHVFLC
jgi:hypothetical protein